MDCKNQNKFLEQACGSIIDSINKNLPNIVKISVENLEWSAQGKGDIAFPCFILSKTLKKNPVEIANELSKKISAEENKFFVFARSEGAYLNFTLNKIFLAKSVLTQIQKEKQRYGSFNIGKNKKIAIEYVSPNTNKPLHIGHLRNAFIGYGVGKIMKNYGYDPISVILFNDRGAHICKSMLAYQKWGKRKLPHIKPDHFVGDFYVMFAKKAEKDKKLEVEAQEMLADWEKGGKETLSLWKTMNYWAFSGFEDTFKKIGIKFDKKYFESKLYKKGAEMIEKAAKNHIFDLEKNGAISANLEKYHLSKKILQRGDGTSLYIAQDIALAQEKNEKLKPCKSIYVVASEQNLYFEQLFAILEMLKIGNREKNCHLSYGMVNLPDGKMKSREGKVVDADDLIASLENLAKEEIKKRETKIAEKELAERAEKIALAAVKFYILQISLQSEITFDPKKSLDFKGKTGPYMLYTYARIQSILRKSKIKTPAKINFSELADLGCISLLLAKFPQICAEAAETCDVSVVAKYIYELADEANKFYHEQSVLKSSEERKNALVLLLGSINIVLKKGLELLGIETLEKM